MSEDLFGRVVMRAESGSLRPRSKTGSFLIATTLFWAFVASPIAPYAAEAAEIECASVGQRWDDERYFRWRGRVDGVDEIAIRGSSIRIRHISAKPIQEQDYRFGSPLPRDEVDVYLNVIEGRGNVRLIQEPSRSNNYTAVVCVDDGNKGGDAIYEFELTWSQRSRFRSDTWSSGSAWGDEESFQWRGMVDGIDEIVIRDRSVRINHIAAKPIQNQDYRFSAPLPRYETDCRLNVIEGRGRVRLIQEPSRSNNYTAVVRVDDGDKSGDAYYEFELVWTTQKYGWGGSSGDYASFHWKGRVDIGAVVRIRGNEHRVEDLGGSGARELESWFSEPLPQTDIPVSVRKLDGRGKVELVEMPGRANGYTAVVRIEDEKSGADTYEFELTWQR
jgi:hypothetical protein